MYKNNLKIMNLKKEYGSITAIKVRKQDGKHALVSFGRWPMYLKYTLK